MADPTGPNADDQRALGRKLALTAPARRELPAGDQRPQLRGGLLPQRGERLEIRDELGRGAAGVVLAAFDRDLRREVAIKLLPTGGPGAAMLAAGFVEEARIAASLDHPNVVPVHEIDADGDRLFFVMKRVRGRSLGEVLAESTPERRAAPVTDLNAVINVIVAVTNAVGYAHDRGIIHQDVKPDNIMLGDHGEVLLADWGSAMRVGDRDATIYGTPLYMSPEQARSERPDARSDLYCVGATLFHALLLRPPLSARGGADRFWERKRAGEIDEPTAEERSAAAAPLIAIARKAMSADPQDRYPRAEELVRDLRRFQEGLAVSAYGESLLERFARWHRRHSRVIAVVAAATLVIAALVIALFGERLKDIATWGAPVVEERFKDDSWRDRWAESIGAHERLERTLVDRGSAGALLSCRQRLPDDAAIEFTGWIEPGTPVGDLSVWWSRERFPNGDTSGPHWRIQFGASGGACSRISAPDQHVVACSPVVPMPGKRYRIRVEVLGRELRMLVDGRVILVHSDERYALGGGWFSIYTFYPGKHIADVRVYARGVPERVRVTTAADLCAQHGLNDVAAAEYERIADSHPGSDLGDEALFKLGCIRDGDAAARDEAWSSIVRQEWRDQAEAARIDAAFAAGDRGGGLSRLEALAQRASPPLRQALAVRWNAQVHAVARAAMRDGRRSPVEECLAVWDRCLRDEPVTGAQAAEALDAVGRFADALAISRCFPDQLLTAADDDGRPEAALGATGDPSLRRTVLLLMGEPQRALELTGPGDVEAMVAAGRAEEVLARDPTSRGLARIATGRLADEFDANWPTLRAQARALAGQAEALTEDDSLPILMARGRYEQALAAYGDDERNGSWPRSWFALDAWIGGDHARARHLLEAPASWRWRQASSVLFRFAVEPLLRQQDGDGRAFDALRDELTARPNAYKQVPRYLVRFIVGDIDESGFRARPLKRFLDADLAFASAIKADRAGETAPALTAYAAWLRMPAWQRGVWPDPVLERFARWRVAQLSGL